MFFDSSCFRHNCLVLYISNLPHLPDFQKKIKIMQVKFRQLDLDTPCCIQSNIAAGSKINEISKYGEQRKDSFKVH